MSKFQQISDLTDTCVKCGMCLPTCPTYQLFKVESEGPRGRIALMEGLNNGSLQDSDELNLHLSHCLGCGNCEAICPIPVEYAKIYELSRSLYSFKKNLLTKAASFVAKRTFSTWKLFAKINFILSKLRVYAILSIILKPLKFLPKHLPALIKALGKNNNIFRIKQTLKNKTAQESVNLFVGCFNSILDQTTTQSAVNILNKLGIYVNILHNGCCGLVSNCKDKQNTFPHKNGLKSLFINPACGYQLQQTNENHNNLQEIVAFIANHPKLKKLNFKANAKNVCIHFPCTLVNLVKSQNAISQLLELIPEITVSILPYKSQCCGAAGTYMLEFPEESEQLINKLLAEPDLQQADILVTSNIGCSLFIATKLNKINKNLQCIHPLTLMEESL